jgi:hypothetical protein
MIRTITSLKFEVITKLQFPSLERGVGRALKPDNGPQIPQTPQEVILISSALLAIGQST